MRQSLGIELTHVAAASPLVVPMTLGLWSPITATSATESSWIL